MEELKVTFTDKVSIVTKPVPLINKVTDADMNQLKNKHNDTVDVLETVEGRLTTAEGDLLTKQDNLGITDETTYLLTPLPIQEGAAVETKYQTETEVLGTIATEVPTESAQFSTEAGIAYLDTPFLPRTVTSVTFNRSQIFGEEILPIYNFLSISKTGAKHENKCLVIHSSLIVPEILVANKPISPLPTYADQAEMLADQASQVEGEYYYYTGSTSAWLKLVASTGAIGDYTEHEAIAGWEEWGTRPSWLQVTGTYLVGSANINYLHFQYFKSKSGNTTDFDFVECNVVSLENGNLDPNANILHTIIQHNYNENIDPVQVDSITNSSLYGELFPTTMTNPNNARYDLLSAGNYALNVGNLGSGDINSTTVRAMRQINMPTDFNRWLTNQEITITWKGEIKNTGSVQNRGLFSNSSDDGFTGFAIVITTTFQLQFRCGTGSANRNLTTSASQISEDSGQWVIQVTAKKVSPTLFEVNFYRKSTTNTIDWQQVGTTLTDSNNILLDNGSNIFDLDRRNPASAGRRGSINDYLQVDLRILTAVELENLATQLDG
jgi:hypothetical protein